MALDGQRHAAQCARRAADGDLLRCGRLHLHHVRLLQHAALLLENSGRFRTSVARVGQLRRLLPPPAALLCVRHDAGSAACSAVRAPRSGRRPPSWAPAPPSRAPAAACSTLECIGVGQNSYCPFSLLFVRPSLRFYLGGRRWGGDQPSQEPSEQQHFMAAGRASGARRLALPVLHLRACVHVLVLRLHGCGVRACAGKPGRRAVCKPRVFRSSHSRLYLNVSPSAVSVAGIARGVGRGCSLVAASCICTGMMKTAVFSLTHTHSHKHTHTHIHVHTRTHTYAHAHSQITCRSQCERFLHAYTHTQTHMQRRRLGERGRSGSARGQKCRSLCTTWMTPR